MARSTMDVPKAIALRKIGLRWKEVARMLARDEGRAMSYHESAVRAAVRRYKDTQSCSASSPPIVSATPTSSSMAFSST